MKIVYTDLYGNVNVLIPSPRWEGTMEQLAEKDVPEGLAWRIVEDSQIPCDRTFRNAWTDENPTETVDVDFDKAKDIRMDQYREMRSAKFDELAIEQVKAMDVGDSAKQAIISSKRQALRDMPQNETWDGCATCEDLKNHVPLILTEDFKQL